MNELETHVNRIVGSIEAEPARKLEIRRELLTRFVRRKCGNLLQRMPLILR